jgi:DNA-directed RNA polymerase
VQLANLNGFDKASFSERADWTEEHMMQVYDSAQKPLEGDQWWAGAENPWQALAVCQELVRAYESGNPETFKSGQPIHMDGSCNGLQHYAALGRDEEGGRQVNLVDGERPRDVYSGVCAIVVEKISAEASREPPANATEQDRRENGFAKLVNGLIDRKVVKQTVMTSVYGVTFIGARRQIQGRLEEKLVDQGMDVDEAEAQAYGAASYVAHVTMDALQELFTGARTTMNWLGNCARIVAMEGQPMSWVTPLGLPVSQPYRRGGILAVKTVMQTVQVVHNNDDLLVHVARQRSAFPPNFVHSLDSTHMLLTAIRLQRMGLAFTAVHDSYWTHGADVDVMNDTLRECFVDLYSQPILEDLRSNLQVRFPASEFPEIPPRGTLDLGDVLSSRYFFN